MEMLYWCALGALLAWPLYLLGRDFIQDSVRTGEAACLIADALTIDSTTPTLLAFTGAFSLAIFQSVVGLFLIAVPFALIFYGLIHHA